jgi:tetratricopeptide (TPR) repeat protein
LCALGDSDHRLRRDSCQILKERAVDLQGIIKMTEDTKGPPQLGQLLNQAARLLAEGKAQLAIPLLERAHEIDAQSVPALINLGAAFTLAGRHREAVPLLETARD